MTKMFINQQDMEKIALVLAEIHGCNPDDAYMNPGKWLTTEDTTAEEVIVVPEFKPKTLPQQAKK